ncbi:MAG TPA: hypothetical protein VGI70_07775, partial [Polyangiales bacterium]
MAIEPLRAGLRALFLTALLANLCACGRIGFALRALPKAERATDSGTDAATSDAAVVDSGSLTPDAGHDAAIADAGSDEDAGASDDAGLSHVTALVRGFEHMCFIDDGRLSCWGSNDAGQLGQGDTQSHDRPVAIQAGSWIAGCGGEHHTCAIEQGGRLFCWGGNDNGQLGLGDLARRETPTEVSGFRDWTSLSCIAAFTCGLRSNSQLYCWGQNLEGALGQNDDKGSPDLTTPQPVTSNMSFSQVSAGQGHVCAIREDGALYCWGRNSSMQLGLGENAAEQIRAPQRVGSDNDWTAVGVGEEFSCAIRRDGSLYCWGRNSVGELGLGSASLAMTIADPTRVGTRNDWRMVAASRLDTCAVTNDGTAFCFGRGAEGQIGNGGTADATEPTQVQGASDWQELFTSFFYACGRRNDDSLWCWGKNDSAELGLGDTERRMTPTRLTL